MSIRYRHRLPWQHRRLPSFLVLVAIVGSMGIASLVMASNVAEVLPDVGRDKQGEDPWEDPVGVELVDPFQIAHIPDCAAAPVVRIELLDEDSNPYWEVHGDPMPLSSFAIGLTPEGFVEDTPYREPPRDAVVRLMVVRKVKGVAGVRFRASDLRQGYAASGNPIGRYDVVGFRTGDVCGEEEADGDSSTTTTSTTTP